MKRALAHLRAGLSGILENLVDVFYLGGSQPRLVR